MRSPKSAVSAARSVGSKRASTRPASIRENSRSVLTSFSSRSWLRYTVSRSSPDNARSGDARASWVGPSINVSGVRNSWLTLLKNAVFARSSRASSSARARACSSICAPAIAVPICDATRARKSRYATSSIKRPLVPATSTAVGPALPCSVLGNASALPCSAIIPVSSSHAARQRAARAPGAFVELDRAGQLGRQRRPARTHDGARDLGVGVEQIDAGKRQIGAVLLEHAARDRAGLVHRLRLPCLGRERLRRLQPSLAEHALRRLGDGDEHAADPPAFFTDRAVREDEVALLDEAVTIERQHEVDDIRPFAAHHPLEHRPDDVPDLREGLPRADPHRLRVLRRSEDGSIAVVVELREVSPPRDVHRKPGLEQDAQGRPQGSAASSAPARPLSSTSRWSA